MGQRLGSKLSISDDVTVPAVLPWRYVARWKIRRGNYVFLSWRGDHGHHVHVFRDGSFVVKWDLDNWLPMKDGHRAGARPHPAQRRRTTVKIKSVKANNRKRAFETRTWRGVMSFPSSKADPAPAAADPIADVFVDLELYSEGFTYRLASGLEGSVHVDQVLEYNQDPAHLRDLLLYELTLEAQTCLQASPLSKREVIRRLGTSPRSSTGSSTRPTSASRSTNSCRCCKYSTATSNWSCGTQATRNAALEQAPAGSSPRPPPQPPLPLRSLHKMSEAVVPGRRRSSSPQGQKRALAAPPKGQVEGAAEAEGNAGAAPADLVLRTGRRRIGRLRRAHGGGVTHGRDDWANRFPW